MSENAFVEFRKKLSELAQLEQANCLLEWDQLVCLPQDGHKARADAMGYMAGLRHEKFTSKEFEDTLMAALESVNSGSLNETDKFIVLTVLKDFQDAKKLPSEFVAEMAQLGGESYEVWVEARAKSDFSIFEPYLTRIVAMKRREAQLVGFEESPYDALMDDYEPGLKSREVSVVFEELKKFLIPFIDKIKSSKTRIDTGFMKAKFPLSQQDKFIRLVAEKMGFDFSRGRLDVSVHPFCQSMHPSDVRITTRFDENDFVNQALLSVVHEAGHGLYEQALGEDYFGTPIGEAVSLGIHESQSRLWENIVGRSRPFWNYFYPRLVAEFPSQLGHVSMEKFYKSLNSVEPGFIRTDADEVTYNLHVVLRYEIERELIEGKLSVKDAPAFWNAKMKEYLGLDVPNDAKGILQDSHWSDGSFGYFPTYTLGNLYSVQFFHSAYLQIPGLVELISKGELLELKKWLNGNIHVHGRRYAPEELAVRVTGEKLSASYFTKYLERKYSEMYNL